jgi:hypothetical protein
VGRLVAPEEFWIELRAGASVATASQASGVSYFTGSLVGRGGRSGCARVGTH